MKKLVVTISLILALAAIVVGGCTTTKGSESNTQQHSGDNMAADSVKSGDAMMDDSVKSGDAMMDTTSFSGNILADNSKSKYIEFNKADYDQALAENKIVLLNFYAEWCPSCKAENPKAIEGFNRLDDENVVGFRVNYKDTNTEDFETELAKKFGISYQHTKVIIKNGERVVKSPESWDSDRYIKELSALVN